MILPDGRMLSFPIPVQGEVGIKSERLSIDGVSLKMLFDQLGHREIDLVHHLDPDLDAYRIDEMTSKSCGVFGQSGAAATHLINQGIGPGDLFLFFGTFRRVEVIQGRYRYLKGETPFHALWGFLEVGEVVSVDDAANKIDKSEKLSSHPHWANRKHKAYEKNNRLFVASNYGTFRYTDNLRLTAQGEHRKSVWDLPLSFAEADLTYHPNGGTINNNRFRIKTAAIGQEFVFSVSKNQEVWIRKLIEDGMGGSPRNSPRFLDTLFSKALLG